MHTVIRRTTVEIDMDLLQEAMAASGEDTMKSTIQAGLRELVNRQKRIAAVRRHQGQHPNFQIPGR